MYVGEPRPPPHQTPPITRGGRLPPLPANCHLNADDIAECFVAAVDEAEIRMSVKNIQECEKLARRGEEGAQLQRQGLARPANPDAPGSKPPQG